MDMNKAFFLKKEARKPQWKVLDAEGKILGRLATEIADTLQGKLKPEFTRHTDAGDYVVVINAEKIVLSGNKMETKNYVRYTGYIGGQKFTTAQEMMDKKPTEIIRLAVQRMLPKTKMGKAMADKLKIYTGSKHPHIAQTGTENTVQAA